MPNKKSSPAPVAAAVKHTGPQRHRRNSFQRRSLTRASKILFHGMGRAVQRVVLAAESEARRSNRTQRGPLLDE